MASSDDLDISEGFDPAALAAMRMRERDLDGGLIPCSFDDYLAFLEEVRPSRAQLLDVQVYDKVFSLD